MLAFDCESDSDRWRAGCLSLGLLQLEVRETTYRRCLTATVVFVSWLYKTRLGKSVRRRLITECSRRVPGCSHTATAFVTRHNACTDNARSCGDRCCLFPARLVVPPVGGFGFEMLSQPCCSWCSSATSLRHWQLPTISRVWCMPAQCFARGSPHMVLNA
jgi:hypothetical protein